jgi:hypothetical protein
LHGFIAILRGLWILRLRSCALLVLVRPAFLLKRFQPDSVGASQHKKGIIRSTERQRGILLPVLSRVPEIRPNPRKITILKFRCTIVVSRPYHKCRNIGFGVTLRTVTAFAMISPSGAMRSTLSLVSPLAVSGRTTRKSRISSNLKFHSHSP